VTLSKDFHYAEGSFLWIVNNINFQYFSILITLVSAIVMVVVSYMTAQPEYEKIKSLTYGTATDEDRAKTRASWHWRDVLASCVVLACILGRICISEGDSMKVRVRFARAPPASSISAGRARRSSTGSTPATPAALLFSGSRTPMPRATPRSRWR